MKITKIKSVRHINETKKIGVLELMSDDKLELSEIPETINGFTIGTGSILRTPDGDFTIKGEEEWGAWRKRGEGGGGGSELPEVTSADNGDVLTVVEGAWSKAAPESELPSVTSDDNGDILTVIEGAWAKAAPKGIPFSTSEVKIGEMDGKGVYQRIFEFDIDGINEYTIKNTGIKDADKILYLFGTVSADHTVSPVAFEYPVAHVYISDLKLYGSDAPSIYRTLALSTGGEYMEGINFHATITIQYVKNEE